MTPEKMPERVWMPDEPGPVTYQRENSIRSDTEYVRADLHDDLRRLAQAVVDAYDGVPTGTSFTDAIEALREALEKP